jgi:hypothetical protein
MSAASVSSLPSRRSTGARAKRAKAGRDDRRAGTGSVGTGARVRWDRLGRVAMMFVLAALFYLYLSAGIHMLSTWRQARSDSAAVVRMERENKLLVRQHETLGRRGTLEAEARRLGMMKQGEQPYIVSGLPNN